MKRASYGGRKPHRGGLLQSEEPPSVLDLVPANHPAHFVRELVRGELDLSAIYDDYAPGAGAPPYHPAPILDQIKHNAMA